jgi:hypothetical protein
MNRWITIDEKLPKHLQKVLVKNSHNMCMLVYFIDDQEMIKELNKRGLKPPKDTSNRQSFYFASLECPGNYLNSVTHWTPLPDFIEDQFLDE